MLRTKSGLPKHCYAGPDRHGKRRVRFRKGGFSTYLTGTPWSETFMRQYARALDGVKASGEVATGCGVARTKHGSVSALVVRYYRSPDFLRLKPTTQVVRRRIIEHFRHAYGDLPVNRLTRAHARDIIGAKVNTPHAANGLLKVLRILHEYAVNIEMIEHNPFIGVKRYKGKGGGFPIWTEPEISQFEQHYPIGTRARLALALLLFTAQRRGDVVKMGWQRLCTTPRGPGIAVRQEKTNSPLIIPVHPELATVLASASRSHLTFLVTKRGAPYTAGGFGYWFRRRCNEAGLPHLSAHGLRKSAATRLANIGCSTDHIRAITGHRSITEVTNYTRAADQQRLAWQAMAMQVEAEREQKLPNLQTGLGKTRRK